MSANYTAADLIREVRAVAELAPDFNYRDQGVDDSLDCSYFGRNIGDPSGEACIVGQAFTRLGGAPDGLAEYELNPEGTDTGIISVLKRFKIEHTRAESRWLEATQHNQDRGYAWGLAVEQADILLRQLDQEL